MNDDDFWIPDSPHQRIADQNKMLQSIIASQDNEIEKLDSRLAIANDVKNRHINCHLEAVRENADLRSEVKMVRDSVEKIRRVLKEKSDLVDQLELERNKIAIEAETLKAKNRQLRVASVENPEIINTEAKWAAIRTCIRWTTSAFMIYAISQALM